MRAFFLTVNGVISDRLAARSLIAGAIAVILSCSSLVTGPEIESVTVALTTTKPTVGQTLSAVATIRDQTGLSVTGRPITWSLSNPAVASITSSGNNAQITTLAAGETVVTATADGHSGGASLSIDPVASTPVASTSVELAASSLNPGQTTQATATTRDASNAVLTGRAVSWSSSNSAVATVSGSGLVTAVAVGTVQITATSEGRSGSAALTVPSSPPPPPAAVASVAVALSSASITVGQTTNATATLRDASGNTLTGRAIAWSSSNAGIASVNSSGVVTAVSAGSANIVATSEGQNGSAALTVSASPPPPPAPVASVSVAPATSSLTVGGSVQLSATTRDASGNTLTGRSITWSSSNTGVATVSSSGVATAVSAGSANIVASSEGQSGSAALTVTAPAPAPVASVTVSPANAAITVGQTQQLTATLRDANNNVLTGRSTAWTSSNTAVATTSASGLVTAQVAGSATITATSEGVGGSATITVSSLPPAGGPVIFSDDFESGSLSKWDEATSATLAVINNSASAHSGNSFLRMTYGINGGDGGWMNKFFAQGYTRMYVKMWVRFSSNFAGGTKLVALRGAPIGQPRLGVGRAGICPNGRDSFSANLVTELTGPDTYPTRMYTYWQDMWADGNGQCWGRYGPTPSTWTSPYITPMPMISKGSWHLIEFAVKMNSSATAADGEQKFWIDGVKYGDWMGIRWGDPAFVNLGVLQINGSGTTLSQTLDIDDLVLIYDYPSQ
jgi:uncharacterized protein YjdB